MNQRVVVCWSDLILLQDFLIVFLQFLLQGKGVPSRFIYIVISLIIFEVLLSPLVILPIGCIVVFIIFIVLWSWYVSRFHLNSNWLFRRHFRSETFGLMSISSCCLVWANWRQILLIVLILSFNTLLNRALALFPSILRFNLLLEMLFVGVVKYDVFDLFNVHL